MGNLFNTDIFFGPTTLDFDGGLLNLNGSPVVPGANIIENGKDYKIEFAAPGIEKKISKLKFRTGF